MIEVEGLTFGADPEFFLLDRDTMEGRVFNATKGVKGKPEWIQIQAEGEVYLEYGLLKDGVCAEINVKPNPNPYTIWKSCVAALADMNHKQKNKAETFYCTDVATFSANRLTEPADKEIGCSADFDAYSDMPQAPRDIEHILAKYKEGYRYAGGHVHMGYPPNDIPKFVVARLLDMFTCPYRHTMGQNHRSDMYGQPGLYRPTDYGIEYRTPDNRWVEYKTGARMLFRGMQAVGYIIKNADLVKTIWQDINWSELHTNLSGYAHIQGKNWEDWLNEYCQTIKELEPVVEILKEPFQDEPDQPRRWAAGAAELQIR